MTATYQGTTLAGSTQHVRRRPHRTQAALGAVQRWVEDPASAVRADTHAHSACTHTLRKQLLAPPLVRPGGRDGADMGIKRPRNGLGGNRRVSVCVPRLSCPRERPRRQRRSLLASHYINSSTEQARRTRNDLNGPHTRTPPQNGTPARRHPTHAHTQEHSAVTVIPRIARTGALKLASRSDYDGFRARALSDAEHNTSHQEPQEQLWI